MEAAYERSESDIQAATPAVQQCPKLLQLITQSYVFGDS